MRAWVVAAVGALCAVLAVRAPAEQRVWARVAAVHEDGAGTTLVLDAGQQQGLLPGAHVSLLREAAPIVHPITGQVLGVPQEPVGEAVVTTAERQQAEATVTRIFSAPAKGDIVEYEPQYPSSGPAAAQAPAPAPAPAAVSDLEPSSAAPASPGGQSAASTPTPSSAVPSASAEAMQARIDALEQELARYRRGGQATSAYPVFAEQVWEEMASIKSHLMSIDERLVQLEGRQEEDRGRLGAVLSGHAQQEDAQEFTIRYSPRAEVRLRVAGTTLMVDVDVDTLRLHEVAAASAAPPEPAAEPEPAPAPGTGDSEPTAYAPPDEEALPAPEAAPPAEETELAPEAAPQEEEALTSELPPESQTEVPVAPSVEEPWYRSRHMPVAAFMVIALIGLGVYHIIRRRHEARVAEFDHYGDDDDELEDEDDEDDDEKRG